MSASWASPEQLHEKSAHFWDAFYAKNEHRFFKDRRWLRIEFPELYELPADAPSYRVLEIGCGAGNTMFPLLASNDDPRLFVYGCDYSTEAVSLVKVLCCWVGAMRESSP